MKQSNVEEIRFFLVELNDLLRKFNYEFEFPTNLIDVNYGHLGSLEDHNNNVYLVHEESCETITSSESEPDNE
jgi:hypothetical protein